MALSSAILIVFSLVQIGPPNPRFLKSTDKSTWSAKDVADSVFSDKSALVINLPLFSALPVLGLNGNMLLQFFLGTPTVRRIGRR